MIGCLSVDAALILLHKKRPATLGCQPWKFYNRVTAQEFPSDFLRYTTSSAGTELAYRYSGAISIFIF